MMRAALLWPMKVAVIAAALWYFLRDPLPSPVDWIVAGISAVLLHLAYAAATTGVRRSGDAQLLQKAGFGEPLADGKRAVLVGTLRTPAPLRAPISGADCAGYSYEIYHFVYSRNRDGSSSSRKVTDYSGIALASSVIHTVQGDYPLLAYPFLNGFPEQTFSDEEHRARAVEYVRATPFAHVAPLAGELFALDRAMAETGESLRKDWRMTDSRDDLGDITMSEQCIPANANVCAFGIYSAEKRSLVPDMAHESRSLLLVAGDAEQARQRLTSGVSSSRTLAIASFVPAAAVVAFVLFAPYHALARVPGGSVIIEKQTTRLTDAIDANNLREMAAAMRYLDPNVPLEMSRTPLMFVQSAEAADLLVTRGANVAAHDANGYSVLMNLAPRGSPDLLRYLVAHGANANEPLGGNASITPVSIAREYHNTAGADALASPGTYR